MKKFNRFAEFSAEAQNSEFNPTECVVKNVASDSDLDCQWGILFDSDNGVLAWW